jgi:hypothetical protein
MHDRFFPTVITGFLVASISIPVIGYAQVHQDIAKAMAELKMLTEKLGPPSLQGTAPVSGKNAAALYFGKTEINNNFTAVDKVVKDNGGTATIFAKTGDEYVRVSTNVPHAGGRATGTILDPKGPVIVKINAGEPFYGDVDILGTKYATGYEPIKDASGKIIGIWYVGYKK